MTDTFYSIFLEYVNPKEKQKLCTTLQNKKVRVAGFRSLSTVPAKMLAKQFAQNEATLFKILQTIYKPNFQNTDEAIAIFSPETALMCLTYFLSDKSFDESILISLMNQKTNEVSKASQHSLESDKQQKKEEEFRKKYLLANKELEQAKINLSKAETTILELENQLALIKEELEEKNIYIKSIEENYASDRCNYENTIAQLNNLIQKCNDETSLDRDTEDDKKRILILSRNKVNVVGADILLINDIINLPDIIDNYDEILYVSKDLTFAEKRYLERNSIINPKLHSFITNPIMIDYVQKGRK